MTKLIIALISVLHGIESSYSSDPRMGDKGPLQIEAVFVKDVNRILAKHKSTMRYRLEDRVSLEKSREMAFVYLSYWGPLCAEKYGKPLDTELLARLWHRGPTRLYDALGDRYWAKVRKEIGK